MCIGEGEYTMLELCQYLEGKRQSLSEIKGLCLKEGQNVIRTLPRPFIQDLDSIPFPARDLVDLNLYQPHAFNYRRGPTATIITSRGCPFRCTFCASKLTLGGSFRARGPENVLEEIRFLVTRHKVRHILIQDDTFTFDVERAKKICRMLMKEKFKIEWFAFSQVSKVDEELFYLMKQAGCYCVGFGIESADEDVLKNMRKSNTVKSSRFAVESAKKYGLKTQAYFIFGSKGDTRAAIEKTIRFACRLSPTIAFFNKLVPYPGTEIFNDYFKEQTNSDIDWKEFVPYGVSAVSSTESLSKRDLELFAFKANLLFYCRPKQLLAIIAKIRTFYELKEYFKGAFALMLQMLRWKHGKGK